VKSLPAVPLPPADGSSGKPEARCAIMSPFRLKQTPLFKKTQFKDSNWILPIKELFCNFIRKPKRSDMKKIYLLLLLAFSTKLMAQQNDYLVSWKGIGALKIGLKKDEVEKLIGKKITLKNLLDKDGYSDTIKAKYKAIDVQVYLEKQYKDDEKYDIVVSGVRTTSPLCKTASGVSIGSDKMNIISLYENYSLFVFPEYDDKTNTTSKTRSVINISGDDSGNALILYLTNKKVTAIEVTYSEGD
jgi:transposase